MKRYPFDQNVRTGIRSVNGSNNKNEPRKRCLLTAITGECLLSLACAINSANQKINHVTLGSGSGSTKCETKLDVESSETPAVIGQRGREVLDALTQK